MAIDILDILKQRFAGEEPEPEFDLTEAIASGAKIDYGPPPEPKGLVGQTVDEFRALPLTVAEVGSQLLGDIAGGWAGMAVGTGVDIANFLASDVTSKYPFFAQGGTFAAEDTINFIRDLIPSGTWPYSPTGELAERSRRQQEIIAKPFEVVRESSDWWGEKVVEATGIPELGAAVSVAIESAALFAGPKLAKDVGGISKSSLLKLRRKLGKARRTGNFSDPELVKTAQDILAEAKKDPAMMADIQRYLERKEIRPEPPGTPKQLAEPAPTVGGPASLPGIDEAVAQAIEKKGGPRAVFAERRPVELLESEGGSYADYMQRIREGRVAEPAIKAPKPTEAKNVVEIGKRRLKKLAEKYPQLKGVEPGEGSIIIKRDPGTGEFLPETIRVIRRGRRVLPGATFVDVKPTAEFVGMREVPGEAPMAFYNIKGGPRHGSTVTAETLKELKIKIPEAKANFKSEGAKYGLVYEGPQKHRVAAEGDATTHKYYDPQTREYFEVNSLESIGSEVEAHRAAVTERSRKHANVRIEDHALEVQKWWEGGAVDIRQVKQNVQDFLNEKPRSDFATAGDYMDFISRGEELLSIINKGMRERGVGPRVAGGKPPVDDRLVVAAKSGDDIYYGSPGEIHGDLINKFGLADKPVVDGFAGPDGVFMTRAEALKSLPSDQVSAYAKRRPVRAAGGELEYTGLNEVMLAEIDPVVKLNDGNISQPKSIKPEDRIAYMKQANQKRSALKQEQIEAALEEGADISDMLPEEAQSAYKSYREAHEYAIENSDPRSIGEIYADMKKILEGEEGSIMIGDSPELRMLTHEQRMALQRVVADAKRTVGDLTEYLKELGLDSKQVAFIKSQIDEMRKVEPETFGEVRQHWIDSRAIALGDDIVKQRKPGRGRQASPVYRSEMKMVQNAKELPKPLNMKVGLTNPIRALEKIDPTGVGLKEVYYDYRQAEQLFRREKAQVTQEMKGLKKGVSWKSRKRIGAYAIAQQERGLNILRRMKINVPELTPAEMAVYENLRARYEALFERIQTMREMIGKEPLEKVDNYFTFFRTFGILEKAGVKFNPLLDKPTVIAKAYSSYGSTPFKFGVERVKKGAMPVELDPFKVFETYSDSALRHLHLSPWVAKMNELLGPLPDPRTGKLTWKLSERKPNTYHFLRNWVDHIAGKPTALQFGPRIDRMLNRLNKNLAYAVLGGNLRSALIQPTALKNTIAEIGIDYTFKGVKSTLDDVIAGAKNREFALKHSKVLDSRTFDVVFEDAMKSIMGGRIGELQDVFGRATLKPMQRLDMETATMTWNGAFKLAKDRGMSFRKSVNFADDVVTRTQASSLPGDLAPIQWSAFGKTLTAFQTFVINDWGFLTSDVLGIGNPSISNKVALRKVMRVVAATTAINMLMEGVGEWGGLGMQSPFPTPIRDIRESIENDDPAVTTAIKAAFGLIDPVPIIGSARYGKGPGGPVYELGQEAVKSALDAPMSKHPAEVAGKALGVPGTTQIGKSIRAKERGETLYGIVVGRYRPEDYERRKQRNPLEGLKGLSGF